MQPQQLTTAQRQPRQPIAGAVGAISQHGATATADHGESNQHRNRNRNGNDGNRNRVYTSAAYMATTATATATATVAVCANTANRPCLYSILRTKIASYNQKENDESPSYDRDCVMRGCIGDVWGGREVGVIGRKVNLRIPQLVQRP